uniref:C-type lectin domain family 17, member A n=1 Tax=Urocitellus parryii TaxID=9999 RepID=UPI000E55AA8B|nr:C-type lectin domain family 17, member A [Urocitellus parryii]
MSTLYTNTGRHYPPGTTVEESDGDGDDYENMAPPYKDLPPKPDSMAPPRPPRAGKKPETPPLPSKPLRMTALGLPPVPRKSHQLVTGMAGLAGLKKDIDRVRADTNQSLVELRGLLDCTRITCPEGWLPFEGRCYYFSPSTKSWDEARKFCQENYSHLVIINSFAEHTGDSSFWAPQEPNNIYEEDCASMNNGGTWNDLSCAKTTYWICERKCSC